MSLRSALLTVVVLGLTACSSSSDSAAAPADAATVNTDGGASQTEAAGLEAFCAEYASLVGERPESYVGSAEHLADTEGLLAVAPAAVAPDLVRFRDFLKSGAIDSVSDPDSNLAENWPDDVQSAIGNVVSFNDDNC